MPLIVAPDRLKLTADRQVVFLAGSIEMGLAENWQDELAQRLLAHFPDADELESVGIDALSAVTSRSTPLPASAKVAEAVLRRVLGCICLKLLQLG